MKSHKFSTYRGAAPARMTTRDPDPVSTEILRHALTSAAKQMYIRLVRTSVSPIIYSTVDFSIGIFDRHLRMLSQSPGHAMFMGTLSFSLEGAIRLAGGVERLKPGDVIILNIPYQTGTHPNDMALIMPVFLDRVLVTYTALKFHLSDMAGKAPYITDSTDLFQEGTLYPGVKLFNEGTRNEEIFRFLMANTRVPKQVAGDLAAGIAALNTGATETLRIVRHLGESRFRSCVEHMLNEGEQRVLGLIKSLPKGRFTACGSLDNDGVTTTPVPLSVTVEIREADICVDLTDAPDAVGGPYNCPVPLTVSAAKVAITMLAGKGEYPNDGHFRPIVVRTRPGSLFEPTSPAPCFLAAWPALQVIDLIYLAISKADSSLVPAGSGGDVCGTMLWGYRKATGEPWCDGQALPIGQGGSSRGDGISHCHIALGAQALSQVEDWDHKWPMVTECVEFITDSCGAGQFRGAMGVRVVYRALEDMFATPTIERSNLPGWGLAGGTCATPNQVIVHLPDGRQQSCNKGTGVLIPKDSLIETRTGGGGGFGPPGKRALDALLSDYIGGYITKSYLTRHYPTAAAILDAARARAPQRLKSLSEEVTVCATSTLAP